MQIVIIGNGISGITAALSIRRQKPDWRISVISDESDVFFSRPALMYLYLGHMRFDDVKPYEDWVWDVQRIERVRARVTQVDVTSKSLHTEGRGTISYDKLIIATGSVANRFGWPGQDLKRVHGMVSLSDLSSLEDISGELKHAVLVGGGLIGVELAEMLHARNVGVTILAREPSYWLNALPREESQLVNRVIRHEGIDLNLGCELDEILGDSTGRACGVTTKDGRRIDCQFVGLTAGVRPNLSALQGSEIAAGRGVLVDFSFRSTNTEDVYAIGDCAELVTPDGAPNRIEQLWYTGKMHGSVVADVICGTERTYDRGILYNSAKFIDLEWHTYGLVSSGAGPELVSGEQHLYWEDPLGQRSLRLIHADGTIVGINCMGIRYRHRVCEQWIADKRSVDDVIDHLPEANFDPEFYRRHENAAISSFKEQLR
ncbi:MAG: FAD-dependent oxidoreductase [Myxococcota bacterium]|nr:FAD-dependent oxidoreductase [Myxococcota bacterium]